MLISYNGIELEISKTHEISFEAVYTDDGIDYLMTRVRVEVAATVNPAAMAYVDSGGTPTATPGTLPTTTVVAIRHALSQPGKQLSITDFSGQTMLMCPGEGATADAKGGPFPKVLQITEVYGARTFMVRWSCEAFIIECPIGTDAPVMISNRWSDEHHINEYHLCTRLAAGRVVFRRDFLEASNQIPDDFRHYVLPDVAPGFQRTQVQIVQASSGNELAWRITDVEKVYDLGITDAREYQDVGTKGSGIVKIEGSQGVQSIPSGVGGLPSGQSMNVLQLRCWGNKYSHQWIMLQRLISLANSIIPNIGTPLAVIQNASLRRGLGADEKWAELSVQVRQEPTGLAVFGGLRIESLQFDVAQIFVSQNGVNPDFPNDTASRGSATVKLLTQVLTEACATPQPETPEGSSTDDPAPQPTGPVPDVVVTRVDELPQIPTNYTIPPSRNPITQYQLNMKWEIDQGFMHSPLAGAVATPGSGSLSGSTSPPQTSVIFRIHQPKAQLIVEGISEAVGGPPQLPTMQPDDPNLVLIGASIVPEAPSVTNDGVTGAYRASFRYVFAMLGAFSIANPNLAMGVLPWTTLSFQSNYLTVSNFVAGIIDDFSGSATPIGS